MVHYPPLATSSVFARPAITLRFLRKGGTRPEGKHEFSGTAPSPAFSRMAVHFAIPVGGRKGIIGLAFSEAPRPFTNFVMAYLGQGRATHA
jgi:hypothetical protein